MHYFFHLLYLRGEFVDSTEKFVAVFVSIADGVACLSTRHQLIFYTQIEVTASICHQGRAI